MRRRKPKASREVRAWMARKGILAKDLADELGLKDNSGMITHFVNGDRTSQPIRDLFVKRGCPKRLMKQLDDLRDRKRKEIAA